jgi:hypothetical protein
MSDQPDGLAILHRGEITQVPLNRMLGEPQSWSGCIGEEERLLPLPRINHGKAAYSLITISKVQSWLRLPNKSAVLFVCTLLMAALTEN